MVIHYQYLDDKNEDKYIRDGVHLKKTGVSDWEVITRGGEFIYLYNVEIKGVYKR